MLPLRGQSGPGNDGNKGVPRISQSTSITRTSPSNCLVSYQDTRWGGSYPSAVGVSYSPSWLGKNFFERNKMNFFFRIFFYIVWNCFNLTKVFVSRLFKMVENQSASCLNRGLLWNFCWLRRANHVKFTEKCVICMEKQVFVKKKKKKKKKKSLQMG